MSTICSALALLAEDSLEENDDLDFEPVRRISEQNWSKAHECAVEEPEIRYQVKVADASYQPGTRATEAELGSSSQMLDVATGWDHFGFPLTLVRRSRLFSDTD